MTENMRVGRLVFISYKSQDREIAELGREKLEGAGIGCWMAPRDLGAGQYPEQIRAAIAGAEILVVFVSGATCLSHWVSKEVQNALEFGKVIVPFRIEDCGLNHNLDFLLTGTHGIYELHLPHDARLQKLLELVRARLAEIAHSDVQVNKEVDTSKEVSERNTDAMLLGEDNVEEYEYDYEEDDDDELLSDIETPASRSVAVVVGGYAEAIQERAYSLPPTTILDSENEPAVSTSFRNVYGQLPAQESIPPLSLALGWKADGSILSADLCKMPHLVIAGATGSGKSTCLGTIITSLLMRATPQDVQMLMIDTKGIELPVYDGIPHLIKDVIGDWRIASGMLYEMTREMALRSQRFSKGGTRTIQEFNLKFPLEKIPRIVILVEDLYELMLLAPERNESTLCQLAQGGRSAGIHLVIATQRLSSDILTKAVKENIPSRIAFAVPALTDFRKILDTPVKERLRGNGEMFFFPFGALVPVRAQGALVTSDQTAKLANFWKSQTRPENLLDVQFVPIEEEGQASDYELDPVLYEAAISLIETQLGSTAQLQKRFAIGHPRAVRIMAQLERFGVVGPNEGTKPRQVLMEFSDLERIADRLGRSDQADLFASGMDD